MLVVDAGAHVIKFEPVNQKNAVHAAHLDCFIPYIGLS
jgi:hypothetical protein